jgi:ribosome maturation factor RimP
VQRGPWWRLPKTAGQPAALDYVVERLAVSSQRQRDPGSSVLEPVVADAVAAAGYELETLDVSTAGRRRLVKVVIDAEEPIGLDDIAEVSRKVSAALDAQEDTTLGGSYTLEVTSPGLDRPLTKPRHWRRAKLRLVNVRHTDGSRFAGRVGAVDDDPDGGVALLTGGELRKINYADVAHAVVEVEFKQPPAEELERLANHERHGEEESR